MQLTIHIHSFTDLITNSSEQTYVRARRNSIATIKKVIDSLLALGGSSLKADDVFTFEIKSDFELEKAAGDWEPDEPAPEYDNTHIIVSAKHEAPRAKEAAKILSNLESLFETQTVYN